MAVLETVRFIGTPLKLGTSSARIRILHYVEGEGYQLSPVLEDVSLKVSKQAYPSLLSRLKAQWLIFTVTGNTVTSVEPFRRDLQPDPKYYLSFHPFGGSQDGDSNIKISSSSKIIRTIQDKLTALEYRTWHIPHGGTDKHVIMSRHMIEVDFFSVKSGRCGCCLTLIMNGSVRCPYPDCHHRFEVKGYPLAFWLRQTHRVEGSFNVTVDREEVITTDVETGVRIRATITDIINSLIAADWKAPGRVEALVDSMKVSKSENPSSLG